MEGIRVIMKSGTKLKAKYSGMLKLHWQWNVGLAFTLLILDGVLMRHDRVSGMIGIVFTVFYFAAILVIYFHNRPKILQELVDFATHYGLIQKEILKDFEVPAALLGPDGKIFWMNTRMSEVTGRDVHYRKNISGIFPEINRNVLLTDSDRRDIYISANEMKFRARIQRLTMDELVDESAMVEKDGEAGWLFMVYLIDETQLRAVMQENRDNKPVVGLVYIDNFDEVAERVDETRQSIINVFAERKINKYFDDYAGLVKKLDKDKYLVIFNNRILEQIKEERFSLLEGIKTINVGNDIRLTVSMGIGMGGGSYRENYEYARGSIELALGRGGDQVVLKDGDRTDFFGGKTQRTERTTYVKARVKAEALRELIMGRDIVITMGHSITDMDAFGAAIGVCRAAMSVGKPAHIVLGDLNSNIRDWVARYKESKEYPDDFFVTHEQAQLLVSNFNAAVVVVDTNVPRRTECPELLAKCETIVVLDHHRQTTEMIENASLSYIEPSASSACEMIAEILQYFEANVRLTNLEADSMYAGIIIDTHSFAAKAGARTFEAAAYLRRSGADVIRVRKALRDDMDSYKARADAVRNAERYMDSFAISVCNAKGVESPSVVGAQAANELLNIIGVKASFVATPSEDRVYISARSIDEVNVQVIMERMGGGGHMNIAGAQLSGVTPEEAVEKIKEVLKTMTEEGAI